MLMLKVGKGFGNGDAFAEWNGPDNRRNYHGCEREES